MANTETILGQLVAEWRSQPRPLLMADEARVPDAALGELVSFVLLRTDTATATRLADDASSIRDRLGEPSASAAFKGRDLFGSRRRITHDLLRTFVRDAVAASLSVDRFTTSSRVLKQLESKAGGIRPVADVAMQPIRGRELVPFMNMLKVVSNAHELGPVQVDVLLDRSAQLGLDHNQLGVPEEHGYFVGPGEFNEQADGTPAALQCPSRFLLIAPAKPGPFRDLLLLPDSIAYVFAATDDLAAARTRVVGGEDIVWESLTSNAVAAMVEESR